MLPQTHIPLRNRQAISQTMVRVADAVADQIGTETWLPTSVGVVMILLDLQDATATANGDLASASRARLSRRDRFVFSAGGGAHCFTTSAKSMPRPPTSRSASAAATGWRLAGVVGMPGKAQEWATDLQGKVPEHVVPDGPLTPDGSVSVRLVAKPRGRQPTKPALTGAQK